MPRFRAPTTALLLAGLGGSVFGAEALVAAAGAWVETDQARARLVAPWVTAPRSTELGLGLEMALEPGWHVYWINPGDAGYPPQLELEGAVVELDFPAPTRYDLPGELVAFGYSDHVVYPLRVTLTEPPADQLELVGELDFVVCEVECVPYRLPIALSLPVGPNGIADQANSELIASWRSRVPVPLGSAPAGVAASWHSSPSNGGVELELAVDPGSARLGALELFFEASDQVSLSRPRLRLGAEGLRIAVSAQPRDLRAGIPAELELGWVLTGLEAAGSPFSISGHDRLATTRSSDSGDSAGSPRTFATSTVLVLFVLGAVATAAVLLWARRARP